MQEITARKPKLDRNIAAIMLIYVLYGLAQANGEYNVPLLKSEGLNATQCGYVLAAANLLSAIARPSAGILADKIRSRRIVLVGTACVWLALLAALLTAKLFAWAGVALFIGVVALLNVMSSTAYGMVEACGVSAALQNPRFDFSVIRVCLSIGYCAINFLYTPLVRRFGQIAPFACTAVYLILLLALSGRLRNFEADGAQPNRRVQRGEKLELGRLFQNYYLITYVVLNLIMCLGTQTSSYLPFLLDEIKLDAALVGTGAGIRVAGEISLMLLVPRLKRRISLPMLQAVAVGFYVLQMALYLTARQPWLIMCVIALGGMAGGITIGTSALYLQMMAPRGLETTTLSLGTVMNCLGHVIMSIVGGHVVEAFGIFMLYRISLFILLLWVALYFSSWAFGCRVLKKTPPVPLFMKRRVTR